MDTIGNKKIMRESSQVMANIKKSRKSHLDKYVRTIKCEKRKEQMQNIENEFEIESINQKQFCIYIQTAISKSNGN